MSGQKLGLEKLEVFRSSKLHVGGLKHLLVPCVYLQVLLLLLQVGCFLFFRQEFKLCTLRSEL